MYLKILAICIHTCLSEYKLKFQVYKINNIEGDDEEEPVQSQISPIFDNQGQVKTRYDTSVVNESMLGLAIKILKVRILYGKTVVMSTTFLWFVICSVKFVTGVTPYTTSEMTLIDLCMEHLSSSRLTTGYALSVS